MIRVSLSQSNVNYRNATTDASIVKVQVDYDSTSATATAKLLMQNNKKMVYTTSASYNSTIYCTTASSSYYKSANCSQDPSLVVYCPGTTTRTITAVCPARQFLPQCLSWNGVKYYQDPSCQRVTYSPTNTSCECSGSTSYVSRRQLGSSTITTTDMNRMAGKFSASANIELQALISTWNSAADLNETSIAQNYTIVLTVSLIFAFFILGFFGITCKKFVFPEKTEVSKKESKEIMFSLSNSKEYFDSILPVEFKFRPWYFNFWIKLLECHPHLAYFAPARGRRLYHTKKWLCFCFEVLFFIFMDCIFSPLAAADDSTCAAYVTEATCIQPVSFDMISTVCVWSTENDVCLYNPPQSSFTVTIIVVLLSSLCAQPASFVAEILIDKATSRTIVKITKGENKIQRIQSKTSIIPEGILKKASILSLEENQQRPSSSSSGKVLPMMVTDYNNNNDNDDGGVEVRPAASISARISASVTPIRKLSINVNGVRNNNDNTYALPLSDNLVVEDFDDHCTVKVFNEKDKVDEKEEKKMSNTVDKENLNFELEQTNESQNSSNILRKSILKFQQLQPIINQGSEIIEKDNRENELPLMTFSSLMMLAARLTLLQQRLDCSTPDEELEWLLRETSEMYETDIITESTTTINLLQTINHIKSMAADQRTHEMNKTHNHILHKIIRVRARAEKVIDDLHEMETDEMKEKYLIKKFIVELKEGVYKKVIFRHFFELEEDEEEGNSVHWLVRAISAVILIGLATGCLFYILLRGIYLGQSTTLLWLEVLTIGLIQDTIVLKPVGIWFRFIAIASVVSDGVHHVTDLVHTRVHLILRRTRGVVRHNSLLVQHFNAACRAARAFPHLQTSRLLIALNDYDLPKTLPKKRSLFTLFLKMIFLFFVLIILLLTLMPEILQEVIIEATITSFINFPIYISLLLAHWNIVVPVLIVGIIITLCGIREYHMYRKRYRYHIK